MTTELPWQQATLARIAKLAADGRLPHALALNCAPGWGLVTLAEAVARHLLGINSELELRDVAHPDLRWIEPDKAVIKVDAVRALNEFAVQTVQSAPVKVVVIVDAHLMNANAANALLKTLEEPPKRTHLLLCSEHWSKLPATVRSRCQRFVVASNWPLAAEWLAEHQVDVATAVAEVGYAPLDCLQFQSQEAPAMAVWLADLQHKPTEPMVKMVIDGDVAVWLGRWYRHVGQRMLAAPRDHSQVLAGFADQLLDARRQLLTSNSANARLILEMLISHWQRLPG